MPANVHWAEFIGPAEMRPYNPAYHPFKWRGWWAFGTGALGDMACHTLNMPYMAPRPARSGRACRPTTSGHNKETYPSWSIINFEFPERNGRAALHVHVVRRRQAARDREFKKAEEVGLSRQKEDRDRKRFRDKLVSGCFVAGRQGLAALARRLCRATACICLSRELPKVEYAEVARPLRGMGHAIKGGEPAMSNFTDYAARPDRDGAAGQPGRVGRRRRRLGQGEQQKGVRARRSSGTPRTWSPPTRPKWPTSSSPNSTTATRCSTVALSGT